MKKLILTALLTLIASQAYSMTYNKRGFQIYNGMQFLNQPDLGLAPVQLVNGFNEVDGRKSWGLEDVKKVHDKMIVIDVETIGVDSVYEKDQNKLKANREKMITIVDMIREARPDMRLGFYGTVPVGTYWSPIQYRDQYPSFAAGEALMQGWQQDNLALTEMARKVDVIFPSFYSYNNFTPETEYFIRTNMIEAKKYNKPVMPFICPALGSSSGVFSPGSKVTYMTYDQMTQHLKLLYELADGIVIWGGWEARPPSTNMVRVEWDAKAEWVRALKDFMAKNELKVTPPVVPPITPKPINDTIGVNALQPAPVRPR